LSTEIRRPAQPKYDGVAEAITGFGKRLVCALPLSLPH
jgi:hypothetical protein